MTLVFGGGTAFAAAAIPIALPQPRTSRRASRARDTSSGAALGAAVLRTRSVSMWCAEFFVALSRVVSSAHGVAGGSAGGALLVERAGASMS